MHAAPLFRYAPRALTVLVLLLVECTADEESKCIEEIVHILEKGDQKGTVVLGSNRKIVLTKCGTDIRNL